MARDNYKYKIFGLERIHAKLDMIWLWKRNQKIKCDYMDRNDIWMLGQWTLGFHGSSSDSASGEGGRERGNRWEKKGAESWSL